MVMFTYGGIVGKIESNGFVTFGGMFVHFNQLGGELRKVAEDALEKAKRGETEEKAS